MSASTGPATTRLGDLLITRGGAIERYTLADLAPVSHRSAPTSATWRRRRRRRHGQRRTPSAEPLPQPGPRCGRAATTTWASQVGGARRPRALGHSIRWPGRPPGDRADPARGPHLGLREAADLCGYHRWPVCAGRLHQRACGCRGRRAGAGGWRGGARGAARRHLGDHGAEQPLVWLYARCVILGGGRSRVARQRHRLPDSAGFSEIYPREGTWAEVLAVLRS